MSDCQARECGRVMGRDRGASTAVSRNIAEITRPIDRDPTARKAPDRRLPTAAETPVRSGGDRRARPLQLCRGPANHSDLGSKPCIEDSKARFHPPRHGQQQDRPRTTERSRDWLEIGSKPPQAAGPKTARRARPHPGGSDLQPRGRRHVEEPAGRPSRAWPQERGG